MWLKKEWVGVARAGFMALSLIVGDFACFLARDAQSDLAEHQYEPPQRRQLGRLARV